MQIYGPSHVTGASAIQRTQGTHAASAADSLQAFHGADRVEISAEAQSVGHVELTTDMRAERLAEIRQQIAAGTYDTHDKLEIAVGRLLDHLIE